MPGAEARPDGAWHTNAVRELYAVTMTLRRRADLRPGEAGGSLPPGSTPAGRRGAVPGRCGNRHPALTSAAVSPDLDGALGALAGFLQDYGQLPILESGLHPILVNVVDGEGARV